MTDNLSQTEFSRHVAEALRIFGIRHKPKSDSTRVHSESHDARDGDERLFPPTPKPKVSHGSSHDLAQK